MKHILCNASNDMRLQHLRRELSKSPHDNGWADHGAWCEPRGAVEKFGWHVKLRSFYPPASVSSWRAVVNHTGATNGIIATRGNRKAINSANANARRLIIIMSQAILTTIPLLPLVLFSPVH